MAWLPAATVGICAALATTASAQLPLTSPAQSRIVFNADSAIYTIAADGSGRARLSATGPTQDFEPVWSPDGASIAFIRKLRDDHNDQRAQVWVMAADGSAARPVSAATKRNRVEASPTWSPDGARIAFVRYRFGYESVVSQLVTVAMGGGDERVLAQIRSSKLDSFSTPAWSPDGGRILLTFNEVGENTFFRAQLHVVDATTGARTKLADDAGDGAWSPDGGRIAFTSSAGQSGEGGCGDDTCTFNEELFVMRADGSERLRLTENPADDDAPAWSPDGERIAFASGRNYPHGTNQELYSVKPDGSCLTWLTNGTAGSGLPNWEPGTGRSNDAGGCGGVDREPLVEPDTSGAAAYKHVPVWWLGPRSGDLLARPDAGEFGVSFHYDDCARFEPSECPPPFSIVNTPVCVDERTYGNLETANPRYLSRHEGALVNVAPFDILPKEIGDYDEAYVYTGRTVIGVDGRSGRALPAVIEALHRFGPSAPRSAGLPVAQLPTKSLRALLRARAAYRKYGSVKAAVQAVGGTRSLFRQRLLLDRKLRELGPFKRIDCKGRKYG